MPTSSASESCALSAVDAEFIRDVLPGEIVTITSEGIKSDTSLCQEKHAHCIFEYIYFARLDSHLDGISTYEARIRGGAALAAAYPVEADIVVGVPDSGPCRSQGLFGGIRDPLCPCLPQKQLCGPDLHQTHPERAGIRRPGEIKCH